MGNQQERRTFLITSLLQENPQFHDIEIPANSANFSAR